MIDFPKLVGIIPWQAKVAAFLALCGAIFAVGHTWGADSVQKAWDRDKYLQAVALVDLQVEYRKKSAKYQSDLATLKKNVHTNKPKVQNEIHDSYSGCVANPAIVELWKNSFSDQPAAR